MPGNTLKETSQRGDRGSYFTSTDSFLSDFCVGRSVDGQGAASVSSGYCDDNSMDGWVDSCSESVKEPKHMAYNETVIFDPRFASLRTRREPCLETVEHESPQRQHSAIERIEIIDKDIAKKKEQGDKQIRGWKDWLRDCKLYKVILARSLTTSNKTTLTVTITITTIIVQTKTITKPVHHLM